MNLEELGLLELNAQESIEVEAGFIPFTWLIAGAIIAGVFSLGAYNGYNSH
jgi:hypothetical protein